MTCDEGVYHIACEIQLVCPIEFSNIVLYLGSFYMSKIDLGCLGMYLKSSEALSILVKSGTYSVIVEESILSRENYVRSLKGLQLLQESKFRLKCRFGDPHSSGSPITFMEQVCTRSLDE